MVVELIVKKVIGETESEAVKELGLCWTAFRTNWFSFSYNIPGTTVYRFVKVIIALYHLVSRKHRISYTYLCKLTYTYDS